MAEIRIEFRRATGILSRAIEWVGQGGQGISHCASLLADGRYVDARSDVLAGVPAGIRFRHPDTEPGVAVYRATLEVTYEDYCEWSSNLMAKVTDDYDKDAILGFLEGKSMHTVGRYVCSALVINEVQHVSKLWTQPHLGFIPFPLWKPVHRIDPNEALSIIQTAGFTIDKLPITGEM